MTFQERCDARKLVTKSRFASYYGREHDLYIALPDEEKLQSNFEIRFDVRGVKAPTILFHRKVYTLDAAPLRTEDRGYYCIQGRYKNQKGLHKIPLYRLAYIAFYGTLPPHYHIHHIDRDKHNNAAINLVALTEEEHCEVHKRDVSVPRSLLTPTKQQNLFTAIQQETAELQQKEQTPQTEYLEQEEQKMVQIEPRILQLLLAEYTEENLVVLLDEVKNAPLERFTVLDYLCKEVNNVKEYIRDDTYKVIGWVDEDSSKVNYFSYKYGHIGSYDKDTRVYKRFKQIPGKPMITFPDSGDYGEQDVRYWGD